MAEITILGFETSNNMKVRVALGYKGLPYRFERIDPADRKIVLEQTGQYLTPALLHGEVKLFDSAAILRYLEANFPDRPKLFGDHRDQQWAIEDWELFARTRLAGPLMQIVHHKVSGGTVDATMLARCESAYHEALDHVVEGLEGRAWLVGERMTAADVTAAAVQFRIAKAGMFAVPDRAATLAGWVERVMAYDAHRSA